MSLNSNQQAPALLDDGMYTVVYPSGDYRTLKFKTQSRGNLAGSTIISYRDGSDWTGFGFLAGNEVKFWARFRQMNDEIRLARIGKAVATVLRDPAAAGESYALKSNRCCRCDLPLTVPASIHRGLGPECAKKRAKLKVRAA